MTKVSDIWAALLADTADLPFDLEISDWGLDELLLKRTGRVLYCSPLQNESSPEWWGVEAIPVAVVEDGHYVGRWRVDCGIVEWLGPTKSGRTLGYFGTLPEALEAIETYIRKVSDS